MVIASPFKVTDRIINLAHTLDTRVQAATRDYCTGLGVSSFSYPVNIVATVIEKVTHTAAPSVIQIPIFAISRIEKYPAE